MDEDPVIAYATSHASYERFAAEVGHAVTSAVQNRNIRVHAITHRAKDVESFAEKVNRPERSYKHPLRDITDLAGVRVITYQLDDVYRVIDLCHELFYVWEDESREPFAAPNEFGYESAHIIVSAGENRDKLPEWHPYLRLRAEIQVRTLLQHAWAETSHAYQYKHEGDVPVHLRRQLSRVAALLETADSEFSAVTRRHEQLMAALKAEASAQPESWDAAVDAASLQLLIDTDPEVQVIRSEAIAVGFQFDSRGSLTSLSELVRLCTRFHVTTLSEARRAAALRRGTRATFLRQVVKTFKTHGGHSWSVDDQFLLTLLILRAHHKELGVENLVGMGWDDDNANAVLSAAANTD